MWLVVAQFYLCSLKDYKQKHPEVTVLDPPKAIEHLHNRQSMLQDVADLDLSDYHGILCLNFGDFVS